VSATDSELDFTVSTHAPIAHVWSFLILSAMILLSLSLPVNSIAQTAATAREALPSAPVGTWNVPDDGAGATPVRGVDLLKRFVDDQKAIWSSPLRLERGDAIWALPALAGAAAFGASDSWFARQVPASQIARSRSLSNYGVFSLAGGAAGMLLLGKITHDDHAAETGFLASEAALNAAAVDYALKSMFQRQRPYDGSGAGHFFAGGSSFPSEHAAVSWAVAGVVAHEYPGTLTKMLSYGLASAVTVARITGKEHFPSDAVVGGALGYFIAQQIYHRHRDPEVSEGGWESLIETGAQKPVQDKVRSPHHMGSSYLPLDSWEYPALERLAALGYLSTAYLGIRPWTRMECARLLEEADESMRYQGEGTGEGEAQKIYAALLTEFSAETSRLNGAANLDLRLDSIYTRSTGISGAPLRDGYHFGQTLVNDYGRPTGKASTRSPGSAAAESPECSRFPCVANISMRPPWPRIPSVCCRLPPKRMALSAPCLTARRKSTAFV
jgi:membrane-associated phospholipid phosphatase